MKLKNILAVCGVTCLAVVSAFGQGRGLDDFAVPTRVILAKPYTLTAAAATFTNGPIDVHGYDGMAAIEISTITNAAVGVLTATVETSSDNVNWVQLGNYALAVPTTQSITNLMFGTNGPVITQTSFLPGTIVYPTSGSSGWATPYLLAAPFTNSGPLTVTNNIYVIGYAPNDYGRYVHIVWTPTGTSSNDTVSALFSGSKVRPSY